jgi:hypothetical protein
MQFMLNGDGFISDNDIGTEQLTQGYNIGEGIIVFPI